MNNKLKYLKLVFIPIFVFIFTFTSAYIILQLNSSNKNKDLSLNTIELIKTSTNSGAISDIKISIIPTLNFSPSPTPILSPTVVYTPSPTPVTVQPEIVRVNTNRKQVVFTFDGGSGSQSAQAILDTLDKYNLKGTFFLTGKWIENNTNLTQQIAEDGHEIFNHTYTHPHLKQVSDEEIVNQLQLTENLILSTTGKSSKPYFRAPYGERDQHILQIAANEGYRSVFWTVDALDWKESTGTTADEVKNRIYSNLSPGTIYLMHIGDNITGQILEEVIVYIQSQGYEINCLTDGLK